MNAITTSIDERDLIERCCKLGFANAQDACRAIRATVTALGERLVDPERAALADALPVPLGHLMRAAPGGGAFEAKELFDRVAAHEGIVAQRAPEHAQIVCRALGELMPAELLVRLDKALPASLRDLFHADRAEGSPAPHAPPHHAREATLATGRPGSRHPVSDSAPPGAQSHSVVREDNPHGDTKLSSARGMTQERLDESLASTKPDTTRRVSEGSE